MWDDNGQGVRGDMKAVIKAILTDAEVTNAIKIRRRRINSTSFEIEVTNRGTIDSRLQEPMLQYLSFLRKFRPVSDYPTGRFMMADMKWHWGMGFMASPSVFNFYLPDYQAPELVGITAPTTHPNGFFVNPEAQLRGNDVYATRTPNFFRLTTYNASSNHTLINNGTYDFRCNIALDFSEEEALANDPAALVQHLNLLLVHGNIDDEGMQTIIDALDETTDPVERTRGTIAAFLIAPQLATTR